MINHKKDSSVIKAPNITFYNLNGIPSSTPVEDGFWIMEGFDKFVLKENDITYDIENTAFHLRNRIAERIFGSLEEYFSSLPYTNLFITQGGIDSDIKLSREDFEKYLRLTDLRERKLIYYHDVVNLIGSLQNSVLEVHHLMGEFYKEFNINSFMLGKPFKPDIEMHASGLLVTKLFTFVNHIFICLYSQLDFLTKICYELQYLETDLESYKKLKSTGILIGDAKKLRLYGKQDTVFEATVNIKMVQALRNEIIHNGSFENHPKVFQVFKESKMIEKFILLPDFQDGVIKTIGSRRRFFNDEIKLNLILPNLITDFWKRINNTLLFAIKI